MKDSGMLPRLTGLSRPWSFPLLLASAVFGMVTAPSGSGLGASSGPQAASEPVETEGRLWYPVAGETLGRGPTRRLESGRYSVVGLDQGRLRELLARAPLTGTEEAKKTEVLMDLPWPDGSFKRFRIEQSSIMELGPPVRCPGVASYRGRATGGRSAFLRFDWSPSGFHARADSDSVGVFIRPYSAGDTHNYIAYYSRDWRPGFEPEEAGPAAGAAPSPSPAVSASPGQPSPASIQEISIQRALLPRGQAYRVTFGRDGTVIVKMIGLLINGTVDHTCRGTLPPDEFARVAALLEPAGFFDWNETYSDPRTADGESVTTSAVLGGQRKAVVNMNRAGPAKLKAIEDALEALVKKVTWTKTGG
jgi:hypothetical protein